MKDDYGRISDNRRVVYSLGLAFTVLGALACFGALAYGMISAATGRFPNPLMVFLPFLFGTGLFVAGGVLRAVGARGIAGSGLKLDPKEAREDLKPWSRMAGGMLEDAGIHVDMGKSASAPPGPDFEETLRKLHRLHAEGILTDAEYADQKAAVLAAMKSR